MKKNLFHILLLIVFLSPTGSYLHYYQCYPVVYKTECIFSPIPQRVKTHDFNISPVQTLKEVFTYKCVNFSLIMLKKLDSLIGEKIRIQFKDFILSKMKLQDSIIKYCSDYQDEKFFCV